MTLSRASFLRLTFATPLFLTALAQKSQAHTVLAGPFTLPSLPYDVAALEPNIDKETMTIHHDGHHKAYVDNLNKAVDGTPMASMSIDDLLKSVDTSTPAVIRNNAGGHWNHTFFWTIMSPKGGGMPKGPLADAINKKYGSFDNFKVEWAKAATSRFGSGWAWLVKNGSDVEIISTANQDNPMMKLAEKKGTPILGLDVWEHAYYLKYKNKRADYITAFWNVIDWNKVEQLYK